MTPQSPIRSIDAIRSDQLRGRCVLVRIDADDEAKLRDALPTLAYLSQSDARIVIATHSPVGNVLELLTGLLGRPVSKLDEWKGEAGLRAVAHLREGEITMLKDLALEPGEEVDDDHLADALSRLCDIYCNEAFALSHELRASTVGVARKAQVAVAGRAFHRDLRRVEAVYQEPRQQTVAVLGGVLSKEKLLLAEQIARSFDRVLVAGQLCFPFLIARRVVFDGLVVTDELITIAERMLSEASADRRFIDTPYDFTVVEKSKFERLAQGKRFPLKPPTENVREHEIQPYHVICDIGTVTQWMWTDYFGAARKVFWHGPMGITEIDLLGAGTRFLATQLASHTSRALTDTLVCGGSLVAALRSIGFPKENITHLIPAGRTTLHVFAGQPLPAVEALSSEARARQKRYPILIPLDGLDGDLDVLDAAAGFLSPNAELFLIHVRPGVDEEQYPDIAAALSDADRLERRLESERIFARANAFLAAYGLSSADQVVGEGKSAEVISRHARRMKAELIVLAGARESTHLRRVVERTTLAVFVAKPRFGRRPWIG